MQARPLLATDGLVAEAGHVDAACAVTGDAACAASGDAPRNQRAAAIVAAATRLFAQFGYEQTTMRRIAAEVGVSATALYLSFPDKEAILRAIAGNFFVELLSVLRQAQSDLVDETDAGREAGLVAGMRAYVAFGRTRPDEYRLTFMAKLMASPAPGRPSAPCGEADEADRSFGILRDGVAGLMATGRFRKDDPMLVAEAIWSALHGLTSVLLDKASHIESDPDALADQAVGMIIRGCVA